ncbi:3083_t:CDS:10, partial [Entrophospora sp. SA101]
MSLEIFDEERRQRSFALVKRDLDLDVIYHKLSKDYGSKGLHDLSVNDRITHECNKINTVKIHNQSWSCKEVKILRSFALVKRDLDLDVIYHKLSKDYGSKEKIFLSSVNPSNHATRTNNGGLLEIFDLDEKGIAPNKYINALFEEMSNFWMDLKPKDDAAIVINIASWLRQFTCDFIHRETGFSIHYYHHFLFIGSRVKKLVNNNDYFYERIEDIVRKRRKEIEKTFKYNDNFNDPLLLRPMTDSGVMFDAFVTGTDTVINVGSTTVGSSQKSRIVMPAKCNSNIPQSYQDEIYKKTQLLHFPSFQNLQMSETTLTKEELHEVLDLNRKYQAEIDNAILKIKAKIEKNKEIQQQIIHLKEHNNNSNVQKEHKESTIYSPPFFVDSNGNTPPMNATQDGKLRDFSFMQRHFKWNQAERDSLAKAIESQNMRLEALIAMGELNPTIRRGRWTEQDDQALKNAVQMYGPGNWVKIQQFVPSRTDVQCRERWVNVLSPDIKKDPWTAEDEKLLQIVKEIGLGKWARVCMCMEGRTDNQAEANVKREAERANDRSHPIYPINLASASTLSQIINDVKYADNN